MRIQNLPCREGGIGQKYKYKYKYKTYLGRLCREGGDWTLPANVRLLLGRTTSAAWEWERVKEGRTRSDEDSRSRYILSSAIVIVIQGSPNALEVGLAWSFSWELVKFSPSAIETQGRLSGPHWKWLSWLFINVSIYLIEKWSSRLFIYLDNLKKDKKVGSGMEVLQLEHRGLPLAQSAVCILGNFQFYQCW